MKVKDLVFTETVFTPCTNVLYTCRTSLGRITVLKRETGFVKKPQDIESGFADNDGKFWLASGNFDIRKYPETTVEDAVDLIKYWANTCVGE